MYNLKEIALKNGIVGAGGAGFPTHIKLSSKVQTVIINGAECEPLLQVDQQILEKYAEKIVTGLELIAEFVGAEQLIIATKEHYKSAVNSLNKAITDKKNIKLHLLDSVYPAGDEQDLVYNVTGKIVPEAGLPLHTGVIVQNVCTVLNIYNAVVSETPVISRYLTISGAVKKPVTLKVPIGTYISELIKFAGGVTVDDYIAIDGGPMMGKIVDINKDTVKKTTSGIIILPAEHPFAKRKKESIHISIKHSQSVCEQCSYCTEYCPRYLLGHSDLKPHLMMRKISYMKNENLSEYLDAFLCCECGVCTYWACPMGLSPKDIYADLKIKLTKQNLKNLYNLKPTKTTPDYKTRKISTERLIYKLGLLDYDKKASLIETEYSVSKVKIFLKQHIGAVSIPVVHIGQQVKKGDLIADIPQNSLGARIHSSIDGKITEITDNYIAIEKNSTG